MFHAYTPHGGVAAVQTFKEEIEVAIVDLGVGIAESLSRNPDHAAAARTDDLTAVKTAMLPNVTSTPERNKGWGLAFTEGLLAHNGGRLEVRSGEGHVQRGAKHADKVSDEPFAGTLVAMRIRRDSPLSAEAGWAHLGSVTGSLEE